MINFLSALGPIVFIPFSFVSVWYVIREEKRREEKRREEKRREEKRREAKRREREREEKRMYITNNIYDKFTLIIGL